MVIMFKSDVICCRSSFKNLIVKSALLTTAILQNGTQRVEDLKRKTNGLEFPAQHSSI